MPKRPLGLILAVSILSFQARPAAALTIVFSSGGEGWTVNVPALPSPVAAAGEDLAQPTYESPADQTVLSVLAPFTPSLSGWIIYVRRIDNGLNAGIRLRIRRTNSPSPDLAGGLGYVEITGADTEFFRCSSQSAVADMRCQLELSGASVPLLSAAGNDADIRFTLVEY
jgi:hypothetical protein